eukprot:PhM_4_TR3018/c4_g1_i1/m.89589
MMVTSANVIVMLLLSVLLFPDLARSQSNNNNNKKINCNIVVCPTDKELLPPTPDHHTDASACVYGCPTCLLGDDVWISRLVSDFQSQGFVDNRNQTSRTSISPPRRRDVIPDVRLHYGDWLSVELSTSIFHILAVELLGVHVTPVNNDMIAEHMLCCKHIPFVRLEAWPQSQLPVGTTSIDLTSQSIGYSGFSGIFVSEATLRRYPLSTAANAYKYLPEYRNIFPRAFDLDCKQLMIDTQLGQCSEENTFCESGWADGPRCTMGRYVPPNCAGPVDVARENCQEIFHARPGWDSAYFESVINNTDLNFTFAYLGAAGLVDYTTEQVTVHNRDVIFYWYSPDPLVSRLRAVAIQFKQYNPECEEKHTRSPATSASDCGYPTSLLQKLAHADTLALDPDFKTLFDSFRITDTQIGVLLRSHKKGGGVTNTYDTACDWIKQNYAVWRPWIEITLPPAQPTGANQENDGGGSTSSLITYGVAVVVVVASILMLFGGYMMRGHVHNRYAPREGSICIMFTDVESSTRLWQQYPSLMPQAIEQHNIIIRREISEFKAYEVKTVGDAFMVACESPLNITLLATSIQAALCNAKWEEPIASLSGVGQGPRTVWNGLRVRIGIHLCHDITPKFDAIHQRYDYYGHDVNVAARVGSEALGGQILVSQRMADVLQEYDECDLLLPSGVHVAKNDVQLKGVNDAITLYVVPTPGLEARDFSGASAHCSESGDAVSNEDEQTPALVGPGVPSIPTLPPSSTTTSTASSHNHGSAAAVVPMATASIETSSVHSGGVVSNSPSANNLAMSWLIHNREAITMPVRRLFALLQSDQQKDAINYFAAALGIHTDVPTVRKFGIILSKVVESVQSQRSSSASPRSDSATVETIQHQQQ